MGYSMIEDELSRVDWKEMLEFVVPEKGLISGDNMFKYMERLIKNKTFKELEIPLYITAVDINKSQLVVFNKGYVAPAVRASISIPGVFNPVEMRGMTLVDGAVLDPIPVDILKKHADIVIAMDFTKREVSRVHATAKKEKSEFFKMLKNDFIETEINYIEDYLRKGHLKIPLPFKWMLSPRYLFKLFSKQTIPLSSLKIIEVTNKARTITAYEMAKLKLRIYKPDVLIQPHLEEMRVFDFDKADYAIRQGELAARRKVKDIKKLLRGKR